MVSPISLGTFSQRLCFGLNPSIGMITTASLTQSTSTGPSALQALHSLADPVASAHELLLKLLADLEDIEIDSKDLDLVTQLREQVIQFINPATVDQVREFPRVLQGLGLVHLLDQYKVSPRIPPGRIREAESWIFTFLEREAHEIAEVLAGYSIHTAADVVDGRR